MKNMVLRVEVLGKANALKVITKDWAMKKNWHVDKYYFHEEMIILEPWSSLLGSKRLGELLREMDIDWIGMPRKYHPNEKATHDWKRPFVVWVAVYSRSPFSGLILPGRSHWDCIMLILKLNFLL